MPIGMKDRGRVAIDHAFKRDQQERSPLVLRQIGDCPLDIAQLKTRLGFGSNDP